MENTDKDYDSLLSNVRSTLKTGSGKAVVWHLLSMCDLYSDAFTGNSQTYYILGKRAVGLQILQLLEDADPTAYANMLLEKKILEEANNG